MGGWEGSQVSGGLVLQGLGSGYRRCIWLQWDPVCHQALQGKTREGGLPALWHIPTRERGPGWEEGAREAADAARCWKPQTCWVGIPAS